MTDNDIIFSSFRDPSGFVFKQGGCFYRQVNSAYKEHYDLLMNSGLYQTLADSKLLIKHSEVGISLAKNQTAYKVIQPQNIDFISYPNEWCFSQLKDAALATLQIQEKAFEFGMVLKDSSAFNIQYVNCKPILMDTLSFEKYVPGSPWVAYKQFCQHFLAPLAMMSHTDIRMNQLFRIFIDGIPLDLASKLLPFKTWLRFSTLSHIHLLAKAQRRYADKQINTKDRKISQLGLKGIIHSLRKAVEKLNWNPGVTEWSDYYSQTNYSESAMQQKEQWVEEFIKAVKPGMTWDLGANTGLFSRIAAKEGSLVISCDVDPAAVEKNYHESSGNTGNGNILPFVLDLTNPTGSIGWAHQERMSLTERGPADLVLALALIHHLAITNNVPFDKIATFFRSLCKHLIIEFVPKEDSQVQRLLATREDVFSDYTQNRFEDAFKRYFTIRRSEKMTDSQRVVYLMQDIDK